MKRFIWTDRHTGNPVEIAFLRKKWRVVNEGGEELSSSKERSGCVKWCQKNFCRPINKSWKAFNFGKPGGY